MLVTPITHSHDQNADLFGLAVRNANTKALESTFF